MRDAVRLLLVALLTCAGTTAAGAEAVGVGDPLPAFSVAGLDGGEITEADLAGRPALVLFFASWCPHCKRLAPGIERVWQRYGPAGLQVLAISFREDGSVAAWREEQATSFDLAVEGDATAARFGVDGTPTWLFVDAAGVVRFRSTSSDPDDPVLDLLAADLLGIDAEDCGVAVC